MVIFIFIKIEISIVLSLSDNNFIFSISILIIIIQLFLFFDSSIPQGCFCPRCQSENIIIYDDFIECADCGLTFSNETLLSDVDDDNILGQEELQGFLNSFNDEEREALRRILDDEDFT